MKSASHEDYLRLAIDLARHNIEQPTGGPFGALIVREGAIIAQAVNAVSDAQAPDPTAHAEIQAIRAACLALKGQGHSRPFDLRGGVLYSSSEPCAMCYAAMRWANLDALYYGAGIEDAATVGGFGLDTQLYHEMRQPIGERPLPSQQLLREPAMAVFQAWQAKPDRIAY